MPEHKPSQDPQIRAQIELFKRFVEASGQGLGMADLQGRIFYANATLCRLLGENKPQIIYQTDVFTYYDPQSAHRLREEILPLVQYEGQWMGELTLLDTKGNTTPTIENIFLIRDDKDQPLCIANVTTDISQRIRMEQELRAYRDSLDDLVKERTDELERSNALLQEQIADRKQAETALRESETRIREIIDNAPFGAHSYELADDGRLIFLGGNPAADRILNLDHTSRLGLPIEEAFPMLIAEIPERYREVARTGQRWVKEITHYEDQQISGAFVVFAFQTGHGRMTVFFYDITERKRIEEERTRLMAILESTSDLVATSRPDGGLTYVNAAGRRMLGWGADEDIHRHNLNETHPAWALRIVQEEGLPAARTHGIWQGETAVLNQESREIPVSQVIMIHMGSDGTIEYISTIMRDITERKRAEEQLFQAQKMESIGRLAGGVAHDFNNLLTAISGNTELALLEADVGPKVSARLRIVQQAATSAAELTKQLLAFSRKQIIEPKLIDLGELIWNMGKMLARLIGEDITLRSTNQPGLHPIKVDAGQMQQIIMNLAVNARDAMPEGGMLIIETADVVLDDAYCRQHGYGKPGAHVMLAVSDTGMGMSDEVKEHLFEPFFTTKALGKGTGLGLATVYGAVKQNNGYIDVYSEAGQGTCFKIYFPAAAIDTVAESQKPDEYKLPGGSETVLLVEDDPGVLEFTRGALELMGYHVLAAPSGEDALALARDYDDAIALLMTDVKLPGMNGRQLADALVHDRPDLKVLFNSGYTHDTIVHHGVLDQNLHFIGKPFSAHALARKLRQVLGGT